MAYEKKNIIIGAVAGVLMAALIISGLLWAGVVPSLPTEEKGFLVIKVKDDPVALQELWLQTLIETKHFDLLSLQDISIVLAAGELPVGNYTEIRFHVVEAWANTTEESHKPLNITAPWVMVKQSFFTIKAAPVTTVMIDITVNEQPIIQAGKLIPVAKAEVEVVE